MCLTIRCPFYEVKVMDHCMPVLRKFTGITLQFQMDFVFNDKDISLPSHLSLQRTAEEITIEASKGKDFDICESNVDGTIITPSSVVVSLYVAARLSVPANINDVYESFKQTVNIFNIGQTDSAESFTVNVRDSKMVPYYPDYSHFMVFENQGNCGQLAALSKRQFCQLVVFRNYDFVASNLVSINGTTFDETEFVILGEKNFTESFVGVCEDTYVNKILYMHADVLSKCVIQNFPKSFVLPYLIITLPVMFNR